MTRPLRPLLVLLAALAFSAWLARPYLTAQPWYPCDWGGPCLPTPVVAEVAPDLVVAPSATPATLLERLEEIVPDQIKPPAVIEAIDPEGWRRGPVPRIPEMSRQYGSAGFAATEEMPEELRRFYVLTTEEIAATFGVRAEDVFTLIQARDPEGLLRVRAPEGREAIGVAGLTPEEWNGWAPTSEGQQYRTDQQAIDQHGGVGYDWSFRYLAVAWEDGLAASEQLRGAHATPDGFDNAVAAASRLLARAGVTLALAGRDPDEHAARLGALLNPEAAPAPDPALVSLRVALTERLDAAFGVRPGEARLAPHVDGSEAATAFLAGAVTLDDSANQLFNGFVEQAIAAGRAARAEGRAAPWPFVSDVAEVDVQRAAVRLLGHTLAPWEVAAMAGDPAAVQEAFGSRVEARLFTSAFQLVDSRLQRSARGLPLSNALVTALLDAALREVSSSGFSRTSEMQALMDRVDYRLRLTEEYQQLNGDRVFVHPPLVPMPQRILKAFGSAASYQPDGVHTGLDLRGNRDGGREPRLFAMDTGTVVHVGPLYCERKGACRGSHAVVIDHGNNIYSIYSHNSEASVARGDEVAAGQIIGRQGNEGYSRGPHLHLEVHVGAPWSGDWTQPFYGGEFVNPLPWIPFTVADEGTPATP